jgi:hypothetical protein
MITISERANHLWDQYKYRHEHCWKLLFQVTAAAVIISIVPFTHIDLPNYIINFLPLLAVGLIAFSMIRLNIELRLWQAVRREHLKLQTVCFHITVEIKEKELWRPKKDNFRRDVLIYLSILEALALTNGMMIWFYPVGKAIWVIKTSVFPFSI